jgi:hypothetical protein
MDREVDVLARTLYGEARGEGRAGMEAVANVIMNRVRHPSWWGNSVESVCKAPWQFSCWNKGDPNRAKIERVTDVDQQFAMALQVARAAVTDKLADRTQGADHYYAHAGVTPKWASPEKVTTVIGNHTFLRLTIPAPVEAPKPSVVETNTAKGTAAMTAAGAAAVAAQWVPIAEGIGRLPMWMGIAVIVIAAAAVLVWRAKR